MFVISISLNPRFVYCNLQIQNLFTNLYLKTMLVIQTNLSLLKLSLVVSKLKKVCK